MERKTSYDAQDGNQKAWIQKQNQYGRKATSGDQSSRHNCSFRRAHQVHKHVILSWRWDEGRERYSASIPKRWKEVPYVCMCVCIGDKRSRGNAFQVSRRGTRWRFHRQLRKEQGNVLAFRAKWIHFLLNVQSGAIMLPTTTTATNTTSTTTSTAT